METILNQEGNPEKEEEKTPDEIKAEGEKELKDEQEHHPHHHPHLLTIEHTNHGRTHADRFGADHEPGTIS